MLFGFVFSLLLVSTTVKSQSIQKTPADSGRVDYIFPDGTTYRYHKPGPITFMRNIPSSIARYWNRNVNWDNMDNIVYMTLGTAFLVVTDDEILNASVRLSNNLKISDDLNWAMVHIGDGWTHLSIASAFLFSGFWYDDPRALQTSSQLFESILATGIIVQTLKHFTGRESPFVTTSPTGVWRPFPDMVDYHRHVPRYDAYPSGHIATAMATVVVISENYPEHTWVKPFGYSMMGLLAFGMMNTGIHWASDYPLGIALGYTFAHIAIDRGRTNITTHTGLKPPVDWKIRPVTAYDGLGLGLTVRW